MGDRLQPRASPRLWLVLRPGLCTVVPGGTWEAPRCRRFARGAVVFRPHCGQKVNSPAIHCRESRGPVFPSGAPEGGGGTPRPPAYLPRRPVTTSPSRSRKSQTKTGTGDRIGAGPTPAPPPPSGDRNSAQGAAKRSPGSTAPHNPSPNGAAGMRRDIRAPGVARQAPAMRMHRYAP
jgi:hypothetical protein